uniref:Tripartite motif containing 35-30 n=1 Tax=Salarias fasciatus TaxID=181472 RepID=A0A672GKJ0_SALFA
MPSADPWVGTWRPHKPRGPIAALYGSPGPKYGLPGLTGGSQHDPTKHKAPAFSMGTRHCEFKGQHSPGPAHSIPSNVTRTGRDGTPAFSLCGRLRDPLIFKGPGPGHYAPEQAEKSVFPAAPAYSLSGRSKERSTSLTPGPAAYSLPPVLGPKTVTTTSAPASSLGHRSKSGSFYEDLKKTPGPATYKVVDPSSYKQKPPQFSMAGRHFAPEENIKKPGPGAHYPEQIFTFGFSKAPSFSFGLRHSQYTTPLIMKDDS